MPELDMTSIAQSVRAEAERKIEVLEQIVDTHQSITTARDEFLSTDMANVSALTALIAEAERYGVDAKLLRPLKVDPITTGSARRRTPGVPRGRRSAASTTSQSTPPPAVAGGASSTTEGGLAESA